jgi:peptide/nickel transport system permease protein
METLKSVARSYIVRRIGLALLVMWAAFTIVFIILYLVPGDPARLIAGGDGGMTATPDQLAEINRQYGFDQPIFVQYLRALGGVLTGNLGTSYQMKQPVTTILAAEFGSTFALAMFALAVAVIIGFIVGSATVFTRSRMLSKMLDAIPPLGASLPTFWVGLMLMQFFSFGLHWFPSSGDKGFNSLVLPGSLRTSYAESFVEIAKAKGAGRVRVFSAHALRNALLPTLTVLGIMVANLFAYSTVSEMIFSRNGLGLSLDKAVQTKDIPMVEGAVLIIAGVYVVTNLIIDLIYPLVDPRLKSLKRRSSRVLSSVREETVAV